MISDSWFRLKQRLKGVRYSKTASPVIDVLTYPEPCGCISSCNPFTGFTAYPCDQHRTSPGQPRFQDWLSKEVK